MDGATSSSGSNAASAPSGSGNGASGLFGGGIGLFGQTAGSSGGGDSFLSGTSGFGSLGNGFSNEGAGGVSGGTSGTGGGNPSFDLNDFPSLGGGASGGGSGGVASGGSVPDNGLAAALRQQQQLLQQQMLQQGAAAVAGTTGTGGSVTATDAASKSSNLYRLAMSTAIGNGASNFSMATEDFPALPGAPPPNSIAGGSGSGFLGGAVLSSTGAEGGAPSGQLVEGSTQASSFLSVQGGSAGSREASKTDGIHSSNLDSSGNQLDYKGLIGGVANAGGASSGSGGATTNNPGVSLSQTRKSSTQSASGGQGGAGGGAGGSAISGDYGLLGLLSVIRMTDADRNRLALGSDLTLLGLNLNSNENLYSTFGGPFSDKPATREPHYQLPMCYYMQPPALKTGHLSKFQLETLFYIFYALPKDVLQAYAAQELYTREWRYHIESKLWFKRATPSDGVPSNNASQYIYFDITSWERRIYSNVNQSIAGGFLPEDDVRVKFPSS